MVVFIVILLVALGYAIRRGGGPERVMAGIAATMVLSDLILHQFIPVEFKALDTGHLMIDLFGAISTVVLALFACRFWPMIAAVLHIMPLVAHLSRAVEISMHPIAYLTMQVAASWLLPPLLILGTWRHQQRLRRNGSDRSWYNSFQRSTPKALSD